MPSPGIEGEGATPRVAAATQPRRRVSDLVAVFEGASHGPSPAQRAPAPRRQTVDAGPLSAMDWAERPRARERTAPPTVATPPPVASTPVRVATEAPWLPSAPPPTRAPARPSPKPVQQSTLAQATTTTTAPSTPERAPPSELSLAGTPSSTSGASATSSRSHHQVPAYLLFAKDALPLVLPELDALLAEELRQVEREGWSDPTAPGVLGPKEQESWNKWVGGEQKTGKSWGGWSMASLRRRRWSKVEDGDEEAQKEPLRLEDEEKDTQRKLRKSPKSPDQHNSRALILPPMHMIPPSLTVRDLKLNQHRGEPLFTFDSVLGKILDGILGGQSSTIGQTLMKVELFRDVIQLVGVLMSGASPTTAASTPITGWQRTVFVTVPAALGGDFVSAFGRAIIWLWVFTALAALATYEVYQFTGGWKGRVMEDGTAPEGFDADAGEGQDCGRRSRWARWRRSRAWKISVTFAATSLYLPLSNIAVGALVWSSDYWPVANPYLESDHPAFNPLGPPETFFNADDFCYRTTMLRSSGFLANVNWAPAILIVASSTLLWLTTFLPWRLYHVIEDHKPRVDKYTELGEARRDVNREYERLLEHDTSPFNFLYVAYRRSWAMFKSIYMVIKLVNVLIAQIFQKENCIFRNRSRARVGVFRQTSQLIFMLLFLLADYITKPFIDHTSNRSDRVSRITYVLIALLGLLVALNVPGSNALGGWVLILVNVVNYLCSGYFALIGTDWAQRNIVKRFQRRIDFSIDIFSPHLDVSKHIARRVWQETWSTILLAGFPMSKHRKMVFAKLDDETPFALGFKGTAAERHVENLKILRHIGLDAYAKASEPPTADLKRRIDAARSIISRELSGPDHYYLPTLQPLPAGVTTCFGRMDLIPFPLVGVFRYDQNHRPFVIKELEELERFISQNEEERVLEGRKVRQALRALDGKTVFAPHSEITDLGAHSKWSCCGGRAGDYAVQVESQYRLAKVEVKRNSTACWRGYNFSSGFEVSLTYTDGISTDRQGKPLSGQKLVRGSKDIGLLDDFRLTPDLARLFLNNKRLIDTNLPFVQQRLQQHRDFFDRSRSWKASVLSYEFLFEIIADISVPLDSLGAALAVTETNPAILALPNDYHGALQVFLAERMRTVNATRVRQWWFLAWDDVWRRNWDVARIRAAPATFSPHYQTSICYRPMPRRQLEQILQSHGLWSDDKQTFFDPGFLNRIYFYLEEVVFSGTGMAVQIHRGQLPKHVDFTDLDEDDHRLPSYTSLPQLDPDSSFAPSCDTGGGTDYNDQAIRQRRAFAFERIYDRPLVPFSAGAWKPFVRDLVTVRAKEAVMTWLGLRPFCHRERPEHGVSFDLRKDATSFKMPMTPHETREKG